MRDTALGGVHGSAAQLLLVHHLTGYALHHGRPGEKHIRGVFYHQGKVREGGGIHRTAGAGTHDAADLRDHSAGEDIPFEDFPVAGQGIDAFLDAGAAGVVEADAGRSVSKGHVLHLADLLAHRFGKGTSGDGEILGKDVDQAASDGAAAGDYPVSVRMGFFHSKVGAAVLDKHVVLFKTTRVQQEFQALTGGFLALGVLGLDALFSSSQARFLASFHQFLDVICLNTHYLNNLSTSFTASGRAKTATRS